MKRFKCDVLLFDLDGVLIDSTSCITRHWEAWAHQHGLELTCVMQVAHGLRSVETIRLAAPHLDAEVEAECFNAAELFDTEGVVPIAGASILLEGLPSDAWAIVTSGSSELARRRLRHAGLPIPHILVSGDDVQRGKPAPDPYLVGASRMGRPVADCLVIEDAPAGIAAARAAGMRVIGITTTHSREDLDCPVVISRLRDLHIIVSEQEKDHLVVEIE